MKQLLTLGSNGPNVNKTRWRQLEQEVKAKCPKFSGFVDIGTCNIYIIHNSVGKGVEKYEKDCEQFAIDLPCMAFSSTLLIAAGTLENFSLT